ncbi:MAG: response regulator [Chloroflexi bacterium]|nr:response regulator [Chloroflexota bacterium]
MKQPGEEQPRPERAAEGHQPGQAALGVPLVLVVEDEPAIASLVEALLQDEGYRTLRAETGREAEALARSAQPDLVILDFRLPDKDGAEVLAALKAQPETASIPVIVASAYTQFLGSEDLLRQARMVSKPFEVDELLETVERTLQARPAGP